MDIITIPDPGGSLTKMLANMWAGEKAVVLLKPTNGRLAEVEGFSHGQLHLKIYRDLKEILPV